MQSLLIKPVQRILKYPLLLEKLIETTGDGHPDYKAVHLAGKVIGQVAQDINEIKRRKDLGECGCWKYMYSPERSQWLNHAFSLSLSTYLSLSLPLSLSLSLSPSIYLSPPPSLPHFLPPSLPLPSLSPSIYLSPSLPPSLSLFLPPSLSLTPYLPPSPSLSLTHTLSGEVHGGEGGQEGDSVGALTAEEGEEVPANTHTAHRTEVKGQSSVLHG